MQQSSCSSDASQKATPQFAKPCLASQQHLANTNNSLATEKCKYSCVSCGKKSLPLHSHRNSCFKPKPSLAELSPWCMVSLQLLPGNMVVGFQIVVLEHWATQMLPKHATQECKCYPDMEMLLRKANITQILNVAEKCCYLGSKGFLGMLFTCKCCLELQMLLREMLHREMLLRLTNGNQGHVIQKCQWYLGKCYLEVQIILRQHFTPPHTASTTPFLFAKEL